MKGEYSCDGEKRIQRHSCNKQGRKDVIRIVTPNIEGALLRVAKEMQQNKSRDPDCRS